MFQRITHFLRGITGTSDEGSSTSATEVDLACEPIFPDLGDALAGPCHPVTIRSTLVAIHVDVYGETLRACDPMFHSEILALHKDEARFAVSHLSRGLPDPSRLDDRAAVEEARGLDRERHLAALRAEEAHEAGGQATHRIGAAQARTGVSPWFLRGALIVIGLLAPVAMTSVMYSTFVGTMAANGEASGALSGASAILGGLSPVDQAIVTCLAVSGFISLVVTAIGLSAMRLGVLAKGAILLLEGGLAATLYWMRSSAGPDVEAASSAYAAMELLLTVFHALLCIFLGSQLREAVAAQRCVGQAEWDRDTADGEEMHHRAEHDEKDAKYRRQVDWYARLRNQLADQAELEKHAEKTADRAYRLALQRLAAEVMEDSMLAGQTAPSHAETQKPVNGTAVPGSAPTNGHHIKRTLN